MVYGGSDADLHRLGVTAQEAAFPLVVNDGIFAGSREALLALDGAIRAMPLATRWVDERHNIWWRNQFIFNLALARLRCGIELDSSYNVQLHVQDVQLRQDHVRLAAGGTAGRSGSSTSAAPRNRSIRRGGAASHASPIRRRPRGRRPLRGVSRRAACVGRRPRHVRARLVVLRAHRRDRRARERFVDVAAACDAALSNPLERLRARSSRPGVRAACRPPAWRRPWRIVKVRAS